ncbi:MAG TPA: RidA family protein [Geminicoccus sp.]|uniref:RidA family protein n=1 Tax=Geminicoccus sp. TaxID=2024832 RepID=UPI002E2ED804|nr:RidA family protein [Geminicoccus sp.]HEX2527423.1 RidA family protein [Geminicoccus sp.]
MSRQWISFGTEFEKRAGYSRALRVGNQVFLSGTTGYDYATGELPESVEDQTHQILRNATRALEMAGSSLNEVVRTRIYVTDPAYFDRVVPILGVAFAAILPASTGVVSQLYNDAIKIEIEMDAIVGSAAPSS